MKSFAKILFLLVIFFLVQSPISEASFQHEYTDKEDDRVCYKDGQCTGKGKFEMPSAYPSLYMRRYDFIRSFWPFLRFCADAYFGAMNALFELYNAFQPAEQISWKTADPLLFISATKAAKLIRQGKLKSVDLVSAYIARVREVNDSLNVVAHFNFEEALKEAAEVDKQIQTMDELHREQLSDLKPLYGVPFTSKDNLLTKGFVTIDGNKWRKMYAQPADRDAEVVANMRSAGAILLAITVLPNNGMSTAGDDSVYGIANNPYDSRRTPGGSSTGEGALIGSGASLCGIGNDICGSVRIPAYANGVYGLKPTNFPNHVLSTDGIMPDAVSTYPEANKKLTNGPLCRYAEDLAVAMAAMAAQPVSNFLVDVDFGRQFRLFYMEDLQVLMAEKLGQEQRNAVRKVKSYFEQVYNVPVQKVEFPLMSRVYEMWGLEGWSPGPIPMTELATEFFEIYAGTSNFTFWSWEFEVLRNFVYPKDAEEKTFVEQKVEKLSGQVTQLLSDDGVLLLPLWPTTIGYHHQEPFTVFNSDYIEVSNILGVPSLAMPIGELSPINGMPLGVQLIASHHNEGLLIAVARELERAFGGWVPPGKMPEDIKMTNF